jgi:hypothetical protein
MVCCWNSISSTTETRKGSREPGRFGAHRATAATRRHSPTCRAPSPRPPRHARRQCFAIRLRQSDRYRPARWISPTVTRDARSASAESPATPRSMIDVAPPTGVHCNWFGCSCCQRSPPFSPKICTANPCIRPTAIALVQSLPTAPPDMRNATSASSSSSRPAIVDAKSADSDSTCCAVMNQARCKAWIPQAARMDETPASLGS